MLLVAAGRPINGLYFHGVYLFHHNFARPRRPARVSFIWQPGSGLVSVYRSTEQYFFPPRRRCRNIESASKGTTAFFIQGDLAEFSSLRCMFLFPAGSRRNFVTVGFDCSPSPTRFQAQVIRLSHDSQSCPPLWCQERTIGPIAKAGDTTQLLLPLSSRSEGFLN